MLVRIIFIKLCSISKINHQSCVLCIIRKRIMFNIPPAKQLLEEWVLSNTETEGISALTANTTYDVKKEWNNLLQRNGEELASDDEDYYAKYVEEYKPKKSECIFGGGEIKTYFSALNEKRK